MQKLKSPKDKLKKYSKRAKFKPVKNRAPSLSSTKSMFQCSSTKTLASTVVQSSKSPKFRGNDSQKLQNIIKKLQNELKCKDAEIDKERELKEKFHTESSHMQKKMIEITKKHKKVINDLKRKIRDTERAKFKPSIYMNTSKYSRNQNTGGSNFTISSHSYKTVSNVSNLVLDIGNNSVSKELNNSNA